ncbi:MAG: hypothetical protein LBO74_08705 [Candidatus Symbiothrix sp.]|jgi:hypothetical protein|nr:hypothetical protein [Candidatus Symbiothrix sp.]
MRAYLILINWALSFMGLCIDTEQSPIWAVLLMVAWFFGSTILLIYADKRGWMDDIVKRFKLDE